MTEEERELVAEARWWREVFLVRLTPGSHKPDVGLAYNGRHFSVTLNTVDYSPSSSPNRMREERDFYREKYLEANRNR